MEDAKSIIEAVERLSTPDFIGEGQKAEPELALAIVPEGKKIEDLQPFLDALRDAPKRIWADAAVTQVQSLIDYVNRFKLIDSVLFADDNPAEPSLLGIIDFHGGTGGAENAQPGGDRTPGSSATPRFGQHSVRYAFPVSKQFAAWSKLSGAGLSHVEMADFLSDRQYDIANPPLDWMQVDAETVKLILFLLNIHDDQGEIDDAKADEEPDEEGDDRYIPRSAIYKLRQIRFGSAQRLLQMARTVEISANAKTIEGYSPKTGERTISFEEEHETRSSGRKVIVPDGFLLRVPIFEGETPQLVPVRLQYRRGPGGGIKWFMTLVEWQRAVRFAVKTEAERARDGTGLPLFYGAREV